ncbi:uncharacterized protein LOC110036252 [Phalaenopsis equestris]|uniref:uncharacterized protein LOC110036252 n=1 Tax=Phalaenopsis equestris TaxID=78828 RepID=UPI0009E1A7B1|nr:uncharacterized protein LOC110036252 [Phalaenopsis equestris]
MAAAAEQRRSAASFYSILGVSRDASRHPDRCGGERVQEANRRFQQIQEAYEVLSDERRRAMYDAGLYDPRNCEQDGAEDIEGFWDFVQEMVQLMADVRSKQEDCTLEALQRMLAEMTESFSAPPMPTFHTSPSTSMVDARARQIRWQASDGDWKPVWFS